MSREQQMMNAADRYADEVCDESCTGAQVADTISDFCAGLRAADQHPHWIPVEEELPPVSCGVISDPVLVFIGNNKGLCGYIREGFYNHAAKEWSYMNRGRTHKVTHWMPLPEAPQGKEAKND